MKNSSRFFENKDCAYYPCHTHISELNCLFCFCPFYRDDKCPGNPSYISSGKGKIKDCSSCLYPHQPDNYDRIIQKLSDHQIQ